MFNDICNKHYMICNISIPSLKSQGALSLKTNMIVDCFKPFPYPLFQGEEECRGGEFDQVDYNIFQTIRQVLR